jgi:hypothetical protein
VTRIAFVLALLLLPLAGAAQQTSNPHGALALACSTCHAPDGWKPAKVSKTFRHAPATFPLEGAHLQTSCLGCHKQLDFKGVSATCASCHEDVHKGELGADCARCHTPRSFAEEPAMKLAHELTRFPLRGAHATVRCSACHTPSSSGQLQFVGRSATCQGCHATDARAVTTPSHSGPAFTDCASCHSINTWRNARFDHSQTAFPLVGAHQAATCEGCHADRVFKGKSTQCVSCHRADYDGAMKPRHGDGFPTTCADCHSNTDWSGASFDHQVTRFPLSGAHNAIACTSCHGDQVYQGKSMECLACHRTAFQATTNPPHASAAFSAPCTSCHTTTAWAGATFNHEVTRFPLSGAHRSTSCAGCHADKVFVGKPTDCVSCHRARYDATTTPAHAAAGYSTSCATCHTTTTWLGAVFNHSMTQFPLTGAHLAATCQGCHADGVYRGKPADCYSCHRTAYDGTRHPPHGASAIGTACTSCHTTSAWAGGTYDHTVTSFPLTGAHRATSCNGCHADGVYKGKSTACLSCHQADYTATTQPPHGSSGIGTVCSSCHSTTAWIPGTFNHSATNFPLTGAHTATSCLSCHGDGVYRGKNTACVSCHQADYTSTTNPNHAAAAFPTTCSSCHTTTTWLGATFDHDGSYFPIYSGAHRGKWSSCATCHTSPTNYKAFTCLSCHEHRQSEMDSKHQGRTGYRYDSQACYACHPRGTH